MKSSRFQLFGIICDNGYILRFLFKNGGNTISWPVEKKQKKRLMR